MTPASSQGVEPNYDASIDFLKRWTPEGRPVVLTSIEVDPPKGAKHPTSTRTFFLDKQEDECRAWLEEHGATRNLYFTVNPVGRVIQKKPRRTDVAVLAWLHVDVDPVKGKDLKEERERILALLKAPPGVPPPTAIIFSGGGFQAFWKLREPFQIDGDLDRAKEAALWNQNVEMLVGGDHCHSVDHVMRLPGTSNRPNKKKRERGQVEQLARVVEWHDERVYDLSQFTKAQRKVSTKGSSAKPVQIPDNVRPVTIEELPATLSGRAKTVIAQGDDPEDAFESRSEALFYVCCEMVRADCDDETIYAVITNSAFGISESVLENGSTERYALRQIERARERCDDLACDDKGFPYPTPRNVRAAIAKLGVVLEHDEFSDRSLIRGLDGFGPHLDDKSVSRLWLAAEETFRLKVGKDRFWTIVEDLAMQNRRHPVREYLDTLEWDRTPRLDRWLVDYMGAADSDYVRAVGRIVLLAAVRRVRQPGCKFDEMLVLEGPQGTNKSLAIAALAVRAEWFSDDLPLNARSKEFIETTIGKWIVEAGELKDMRKSDVDSLKSCLSRQVDRARMAYGRLPVERARQFVMIGTTNGNRYLRDNTGNRRFWPVRVGEVRLTALRRDRDQLWAETAARAAQGESIRLDPALWEAAGEQQEQRRIEDPFLQHLEEALGGREGVLPAEHVWRLLGVDTDRRTQDHNQRVGDAMRELGWERRKRRVDGQPRWCYVRGDGPRLEAGANGVEEASEPVPF